MDIGLGDLYSERAVASAEAAQAQGRGANASGVSSNAQGDGAIASEEAAQAQGRGANASGISSIAQGDRAQASATGATASGRGAQATQASATALGDDARATGVNAIAAGHASRASDNASAAFGNDATPLRVVVTGKSRGGHQCEIEAVEPKVIGSDDNDVSVFNYRQRRLARTNAFNAVMLIPTGVDCAIGGHAGDATPSGMRTPSRSICSWWRVGTPRTSAT